MNESATGRTRDIGRKRVPIPIRLKLIAALVVPLAAVASLCWVQVSQARDEVTEVEAETALARTALAPGGLVDALIVEQADATVTPLGLRGTAQMTHDSYELTIAATDQAIEDFKAGIPAGGPVAEELFGPAIERIEEVLAEQRAVYASMEEPGLINLVPVLDGVYPAYSETIEILFEANDLLADAISSPDMRAAALTLNSVNNVHFNMSLLMSSVGTGILRPGNEGRDPVVRYIEDYDRAINDLRGRTDGPWAPAVEAFAEEASYQQIVDQGREYLETGEIDLNAYVSLPPAYDIDEEPPLGTSQHVARAANRDLADIIETQLDDARSEEQRYTYLAIGVLLLAAAAALFVARSIIRPMRKLTEQAEEMAAVALPNAVQSVLDTPADQDVVIPELQPITVKSRDELQTVATAINHVQSSALDLAVEQATLRRNIADSFVSLGRRTQNLIGLQLELITNLEAEEADPAVLESLYRLDHLATRARRNAESLVVLGGTGAQRRGGSPVAMTDVVRAMLSEVEAYQRVDITGVDRALIPGSSAADVIHLLAELVENGLSFSPPGTNVEVSGHTDASGYVIRIVDHGVGMTADRLTQANRRLSDNESFTVAPSRYLGHYVTGKLARRVGAHVALAANPDGGVIATVTLPTAALMSDVEAAEHGGAAPIAPTSKDTRVSAGANANGAVTNGASNGAASTVDHDLDDPGVKVDGRPPSVGVPSVPVHATEPVPTAQDVPAEEVVETTTNGLRKRVPGQHTKAVAERSPLLRSAAVRAEQSPLAAETSPAEAQNLASLLSDYTSGIERGRDDLAQATTSPTETSE